MRDAVLADKRTGMPDIQIGEKYGVSLITWNGSSRKSTERTSAILDARKQK